MKHAGTSVVGIPRVPLSPPMRSLSFPLALLFAAVLTIMSTAASALITVGALDTPEALFDPSLCDVALSRDVLAPALVLEDVHLIHGHGAVSTAHTDDDMEFLREACRGVARRVKSYQ